MDELTNATRAALERLADVLERVAQGLERIETREGARDEDIQNHP